MFDFSRLILCECVCGVCVNVCVCVSQWVEGGTVAVMSDTPSGLDS